MKRQVFDNTIASLGAIIDEMQETHTFAHEESSKTLEVDDNYIEVLESARQLLNSYLLLTEIMDTPHYPISQEMDECVNEFMDTIQETVL